MLNSVSLGSNQAKEAKSKMYGKRFIPWKNATYSSLEVLYVFLGKTKDNHTQSVHDGKKDVVPTKT